MSFDNICKYLATTYPAAFARWLLAAEVHEVELLPTELRLDPILAGAVVLLQATGCILHLEFQTAPASVPALPFRMLDYWVRLYRQYACPIEQVILFLKESRSESVYTEQFRAANTWHRYRTVRLWEQDPAPLLANPALLPLAALAQTDAPAVLLRQVAAQVNKIE